MPFNNNAMIVAANALRDAISYGQLHNGFAGLDGTANVAVARQPITWDIASGLGDFGLAASINFVGGLPGGSVYSITLWDAETGGTLYGEFPLGNDLIFNSVGEYQVTVIDVFGTIEEGGLLS